MGKEKNICEYLKHDLNYSACKLFIVGLKLLSEGNPKDSDYIEINRYIKL
jgi:hypothetical protein